MITEYHCCYDCEHSIEFISKQEISFGCAHPNGEPNIGGGLCRCEYFKEKIE